MRTLNIIAVAALLAGGCVSTALARDARGLAARGRVEAPAAPVVGESFPVIFRVTPQANLHTLTMVLGLSEDLELVRGVSAKTVHPAPAGEPQSLTVTVRSRTGAPARVVGAAAAGWGTAAYHRSFVAEIHRPVGQ